MRGFQNSIGESRRYSLIGPIGPSRFLPALSPIAERGGLAITMFDRQDPYDWPPCEVRMSAQKLKACCPASGGPTRTPSSSSMRAFVFEPPGAEKPPILPPAASTR